MQHTRRREKRVEEETEGRRRGAAAAAAVLDEDQWQRIEKASDGAKVLSADHGVPQSIRKRQIRLVAAAATAVDDSLSERDTLGAHTHR